jgi:hypothetical protein
VHAAFTCTDETLAAAADLAVRHGVGVHVHVAEGPDDLEAADRLRAVSTDEWLLIHGVHLPDDHGLRGTVVHNPRSNMNNAVGYARPSRFANPVALGTDGIGADMVAEFQLAFVAARADDVSFNPETAWGWLERGWVLFPEALDDRVSWSYAPMEPWHLAYTPGVRAIDVDIAGGVSRFGSTPTRSGPKPPSKRSGSTPASDQVKNPVRVALLLGRPNETVTQTGVSGGQVTTTVVPTSANAQRNAASRLC